ncbi:MAG TPA: hypothetical protein DIV86_00820 [Alphaproteobacteria bacterium]|nr:hypothetical protein [Alphaproteobacteria bacterium]
MLKVLLQLWPALVPLTIYLIWYFRTVKKTDVKVYDEFAEKAKAYRFYAIIISGVVIIAMLAYLALSQDQMPIPQ